MNRTAFDKKPRFLPMIALLASLSILLCSCDGGIEDLGTRRKISDTDKEVQVVVLLGQSNAEGCSHIEYLSDTVGEEKAAIYNGEGFSAVKIAFYNPGGGNSSQGEYVNTKTGQGYNETLFGPEVGLAEGIAAAEPTKPVYIIKYAYGGTALENQWRPPSSGKMGFLYKGAVLYVREQCKKLEEAGFYPYVKAVCWMQGESDAAGGNYAGYEKLEKNFVSDLRKDLKYYAVPDKNVAFVDAGISDSYIWTHYLSVNAAKKKLADADADHYYIDTIAKGLKYDNEPYGSPDIAHYDSASEIMLGELFADVLIRNVLEV